MGFSFVEARTRKQVWQREKVSLSAVSTKVSNNPMAVPSWVQRTKPVIVPH